MFARVEGGGADGQRSGLGIGLALGRRLAELHGGTLTAASDGAGRGATFTLHMPIVDFAGGDVAPAGERSGPPMAPLDIVVIEDSEDSAEMLAAVLKTMGHRVSIAHDGPAGIALVERERPRVVLCDLGLPDMDGLEVCRRVRTLGLAAQPVMVALTGWGREYDRRRTKEAGFDDHLVKPVGAEKLRLVLGAV
jgi:CheY-like chemotaxis protein